MGDNKKHEGEKLITEHTRRKMWKICGGICELWLPLEC
jgi:hypothetical protein